MSVERTTPGMCLVTFARTIDKASYQATVRPGLPARTFGIAVAEINPFDQKGLLVVTFDADGKPQNMAFVVLPPGTIAGQTS